MGCRGSQCRSHGRRATRARARDRDTYPGRSAGRAREVARSLTVSRRLGGACDRPEARRAVGVEMAGCRSRRRYVEGGTRARANQAGRAGFQATQDPYGRRAITLPPSTVAELRAHRKSQPEQRLALGLGKAPDDALVFATWDGSTRSPNALTKEWTLAMKAAGIRATFHSLRHTHASTLIASGLDVLTISRRLGHGSPAITLGVYGHLFKPDDRAAAIMESVFAGMD